MDGILANMKKNTVNETELQTKIQGEVNANYPHLDSTAKEFLVTANLLFELHQNSVIDFAPIIVEYSKVVEKQLRYLLGSLLTAEEKMLGQVIWKIKEDSIPPYCLLIIYYAIYDNAVSFL
ncbi:MAG: hypothetical protein ACREV6_05895 [Clostridium sp.]|uniref:hypothetical protein n=1 Tax=Clostridium sp. TaxID=1506 RepID=UPI003D6CE9D7